MPRYERARPEPAKSLPNLWVVGNAQPGRYYVEGVHLVLGKDGAFHTLLEVESERAIRGERKNLELRYATTPTSTIAMMSAFHLATRKITLGKLPNGRLYILRISTVHPEEFRRRWWSPGPPL